MMRRSFCDFCSAQKWNSRAIFCCGWMLLTGVSPVRAQTAAQQKQLESHWHAGQKALRDDQFRVAIAHFNHVLEILQRPDIPIQAATLSAAFENRADAYYGLEKWPAALADYSRVIELTPNNADAYAGRAIARKTAGDYDGLIADAQKAASLDAEYATLLDDARSTVLYRRVLLGCLVLGAIVLMLGAIPFVRSLIKLAQADARR